jgi:hypothetical protein
MYIYIYVYIYNNNSYIISLPLSLSLSLSLPPSPLYFFVLQVLVVDDALGLVVGAVAERMGGMASITSAHKNNTHNAASQRTTCYTANVRAIASYTTAVYM